MNLSETNLAAHLQINEDERNQAWEEKFFKLLTESNLQILAEDPQTGPDGWPYLICDIATTVATTQTQSKQAKVDSAQKILHWLSSRGIGLVINSKKLPYPEYVFTFGMIWSFRETGFFIKYQGERTKNSLNKEAMQQQASKQFVIEQNSPLKVGAPTVEYLPPYVRAIVKNFLRDQGVFDARILMISVDGENYDLCFSLESLGSPPLAEHEGILEALSWFLPPHYAIALVSESSLSEADQSSFTSRFASL